MTISEEELLAYLQSLGQRPIRVHDVARALRVPRGELRTLKRMLRRLQEDGRLDATHRARPKALPGNEIVGRVQGTRRDFAFILQDDGPDLYVRPEMMLDAVHGDLVRARVRRHRGRVEGVVQEVLERRRSLLAGTLAHESAGWILIPDEERVSRDLNLSRSQIQPQASQVGFKALVRIAAHDRDGTLFGDIVTILGPPDQPGVRTHALMAEFDLSEAFEDEVLAAVEALRPPDRAELAQREDLSSQLTFTIDPHDAKDHDDAVSVRRLPEGGFELGVHIADVSHYVRPGSVLDVEAERRATSVYLADRVVPMLPELLSNHVCSLRPGVPRLTQSALMRIDARGEVLDWRLSESCIVSRAKLSYQAADDLLNAREPDAAHVATTSSEASGEEPWPGLPAWDALRTPVSAALVDMQHLARLLRERRFARGSLDIETAEYRVVHDARGRVVDILERESLVTYGIIEEFMLLANQMVARSLAKATLPLLWRIHDDPDFQRSEELRLFLKKLGISWSPEEPATHGDYQKLLRLIDKRPERKYLMYRLLRSLQKARYESVHRGHFGLAFTHYAHFTSPIRRYPDLYNHRLVRMLLRPDVAGLREGLRRGASLAELGRHTTQREISANEAERASLKLKICEFLADRVGDETTGYVSSITEHGLYVDLPEWRAEGLLHSRQLRDDDYSIDPYRTLMRGSVSGRTFRFGQRLRVALARVDPDRRQIDLCLAS